MHDRRIQVDELRRNRPANILNILVRRPILRALLLPVTILLAVPMLQIDGVAVIVAVDPLRVDKVQLECVRHAVRVRVLAGVTLTLAASLEAIMSVVVLVVIATTAVTVR